MKVTHSGTTYECYVAVKCTSDKYIKLYDENGVEIAAFHNISDFSDYTISGGSFVAPCECDHPVKLTAYVIGGRTISADDWILSGGEYYCEIDHDLISGNEKTCDILIIFAADTDFENFSYRATQADGKITLFTDAAPLFDVVIDSIKITKA